MIRKSHGYDGSMVDIVLSRFSDKTTYLPRYYAKDAHIWTLKARKLILNYLLINKML